MSARKPSDAALRRQGHRLRKDAERAIAALARPSASPSPPAPSARPFGELGPAGAGRKGGLARKTPRAIEPFTAADLADEVAFRDAGLVASLFFSLEATPGQRIAAETLADDRAFALLVVRKLEERQAAGRGKAWVDELIRSFRFNAAQAHRLLGLAGEVPPSLPYRAKPTDATASRAPQLTAPTTPAPLRRGHELTDEEVVALVQASPLASHEAKRVLVEDLATAGKALAHLRERIEDAESTPQVDEVDEITRLATMNRKHLESLGLLGKVPPPDPFASIDDEVDDEADRDARAKRLDPVAPPDKVETSPQRAKRVTSAPDPYAIDAGELEADLQVGGPDDTRRPL